MKQLKLSVSGTVEPLVNYFKHFLCIDKSLLFEIDTVQNIIVAKGYSGERNAVRFSTLPFKDAGITVISDDGLDERNSERIKVGVLGQLDRFVKILERVGTEDFIIDVSYDALTTKTETNFVATSLAFTAKMLTMCIDGCRIAEFKYISDDMFNGVCSVDNPVTFNLSATDIASIIKTSDIVKINAKDDIIVFMASGSEIFVKDYSQEGKSSFVMKIGEISDTLAEDVHAYVRREKFIQMIDKSDENFIVSLGRGATKGGNGSKVIFESESGCTKIVIACVNIA